MQKIVAYYFPFSHHGYVTASPTAIVAFLRRFHGVLSRSCGVLVGDRMRAHGVLTACPRRAHRVLGAVTARARRAQGVHTALAASHNFVFKTARLFLRTRHCGSESGSVTHTFDISKCK